MASRMSLTPENTADSAMKSASKARAMSRASVVLPTPGGPHRIIECSLPDSKASRSGLPGPSRWRCPATSSSDAGRRRSASGMSPVSAAENRSAVTAASVAEHVRAGRRLETETLGGGLRAEPEFDEVDHRGLAEVVLHGHAAQAVVGQADAHLGEGTVGRQRLGPHPRHAAMLAFGDETEVALQRAVTGEDGGRRGAERVAHGLHGDLVQVRVPGPQLLAVADEQLRIGLLVLPAELARPLEHEAAARVLGPVARGGGH